MLKSTLDFIRPEILLHPNIPKPLHRVNPRSILGKHWWDKQRQAAYETYNFRCWACGVHKQQAEFHQWLEAHECFMFDYDKGTLTFKEVVALCHCCHNYIHSGRMSHMVASGEMSPEKERFIHNYGKNVLQVNNVCTSKNPFVEKEASGVYPDWNEWKMIIGKKEYPPIIKSFKDWKDIYV